MTKIVLPADSPLVCKNENQGEYFDRIGKVAEKIIDFKQEDERSIRELAYITANLPSDYDWCNRSRLFPRAKVFLELRENQKKLFFKETFLAEGGHPSHLNFYLPDHDSLVKGSVTIRAGVFQRKAPNPDTRAKTL